MSPVRNLTTKGKITIDLDQNTLVHEKGTGKESLSLDSLTAFKTLSKLWLRSGWLNKYSYSFTWLGRPIIQTPEDMVRMQELVFQLRPDVIIETGVAHGGSLIFYASLLKLLSKGKVIGIDIDIREHNRKEIEKHELFPLIKLIEADSVCQSAVEQVKKEIKQDDKVLVVLDSCHSKDHVLKELEIYSKLVTPDSYIIVFDGIMKDLAGAPGAEEDWVENNPSEAVKEFLERNHDFQAIEPEFLFNESKVDFRITYMPGGFLKRVE